MKQLFKLAALLLVLVASSCQEEALNSSSSFGEMVIKNVNGTGLTLTVSRLDAQLTKSDEDTESFLLVIDNPSINSETMKSVLAVTPINEVKTYVQHKTLEGEVLGTYICNDNGEIIFVEVPDDYNYDATTSSSWYVRWKRCVKDRYKYMMNIIKNDKDLSIISDVSNGMSGMVGINPYITETQVATAASLWCAINKNNAKYD